MRQLELTKLSASVALSIPFHDIDLTGVVWHGRYPKYFELARDALMEKIDFSYAEMRSSGFVFPVVDSQIRYVRSLRLHQQVRVVAVLREWEMRVVVNYRIQDEQDVVYTKGSTTQVAVKASNWEMQLGSPAQLLEKVTALLNSGN
jgi:acyl-CoA thioester hydrolase